LGFIRLGFISSFQTDAAAKATVMPVFPANGYSFCAPLALATALSRFIVESGQAANVGAHTRPRANDQPTAAGSRHFDAGPAANGKNLPSPKLSRTISDRFAQINPG
jgi:hypothetical protein